MQHRQGQRRRQRAGRNLPLAIVSGVCLAALFVGSLALHPYAFLTLVAALLVTGLLELDAALRQTSLRPATPLAAVVGIFLVYGAYAAGPPAQALGLVVFTVSLLTWGVINGHPRSRRVPLGDGAVLASMGATCLMVLWVPFCGSFAGLLLGRPEGEWLVLAAVALTVAADIGAFAFGSAFGRHALAPSISPSKTWEGLAGGLVTALVLAVMVTAELPGFDLLTALLFGACVPLAAAVGDLAESLVKRDLGVKDLGRLLPGHGGIMERADAIVVALPVAHLLLLALGR